MSNENIGGLPEEPKATEGNRALYDHKVNKFNRENVVVFTTDERAPDNANHHYRIEVYKAGANENPKSIQAELIAYCDIHFQDGGLKEVGPNGITDQALLAIVLDRWRGFNDGLYRCRENSVAITKLEEALLWNAKRANDRAMRGVEGERIA